MTIWLVRHASAGSRRAWDGPDMERPLDRRGREQASGLARLLAGIPARRVMSSPYRRCVETVEPLAGVLGVAVETSEDLSEGRDTRAKGLLERLGDEDAVVCSHGDVIPAVLEGLALSGVPLGPDPRWPKASTWVLETGPEGRRARYLAPPA